MICKNCGFDNNDNLYICENCGSPLYDEEEPVVNDETPNGNAPAPEKTDAEDAAYEARKKKQNITIIVLLALILIIVIVGVILFAKSGSGKQPESTSSDTTVAAAVDESSSTTLPASSSTTESTTASTTESTTESTTASTTTTTTKPKSQYTVSVSGDGGSTSGGGTYTDGQNATVTAYPFAGYDFDGWYKNGTLVSSNTSYTFEVSSNVKLEARFIQTSPTETGIPNAEGEAD